MENRRKNPLAPLALVSALLAGAISAADPPSALPPVGPPPASFFEDRVDARHRDAARGFYAKHLDAGGLPIVASAEVADEALARTRWIVSHLLSGRPDVLAAMVRNRMYLIIIGKDQVYTDMPENRDHPDPDYVNERVRGTGGRPTSFGEENLLHLPLDRYDDESIAVHEFCHTIDGTLRSIDPGWPARLREVYRRAMERGLWKDTYAASNAGELWAEACQAYFDCNRVNNWNHGPIGTREMLKLHDPETYELVRTTFDLSPEQDWRYEPLRPQPSVGLPPARLGIDPWYTKFTWARELPVVGRGASDRALLDANDTIRKVFAYRHDLLKALIADGAKLVVLGRDERLSDLPEFAGSKGGPGFDPLARFADYGPEAKLIAAGEENVLGDPADTRAGECLVIRGLAKAVHRVAATRPVDPDWDRRGRAVQQYELRVQRMDVRFDERLRRAYDAAMAAGRWKGTAAARDRVEYWAGGVVAYFDAAGAIPAPNDSAHPIAGRASLREYDPGLFDLIDETMAYRGKVDWRHRPWTPARGRI